MPWQIYDSWLAPFAIAATLTAMHASPTRIWTIPRNIVSFRGSSSSVAAPGGCTITTGGLVCGPTCIMAEFCSKKEVAIIITSYTIMQVDAARHNSCYSKAQCPAFRSYSQCVAVIIIKVKIKWKQRQNAHNGGPWDLLEHKHRSWKSKSVINW